MMKDNNQNMVNKVDQIKVCHITSVHARYDIRIYVKECLSLAQAEYNINLIVADGLGNENKQGVNIYDVGKQSNRLKRILITPYRIYQQVLLLKPQIVHFHDPELMFIGIRLAKQGFKVIYDVHENLPKQILSKYWIKKPLRRVIAFFADGLEKYVAKRISGVITVLDNIGQRFYKYNDNVILIHNYPCLADLKRYMQDTDNRGDYNKQLNQEWNSRQRQLVYIGGISEIRGVKTLINSLSISNLSLDLAGIFSGITLDELQALDGFSHVKYHGVLPHNEAFMLLTKAKVGILNLLPVPSYIESLPIKLFEYMAAGIPVVASNFKLWEDIILKYNCGIMVDPNDANAIADACLWLINNPSEAMQMGKNGQQAVLNYFNWEHESAKLVNFYNKVLN